MNAEREMATSDGLGRAAGYTVEKIDPYAAHPLLTNETRECNSIADAAREMEDLCPVDSEDVAEALLLGDGKPVTHTDPETGVEVTARRA